MITLTQPKKKKININKKQNITQHKTRTETGLNAKKEIQKFGEERYTDTYVKNAYKK